MKSALMPSDLGMHPPKASFISFRRSHHLNTVWVLLAFPSPVLMLWRIKIQSEMTVWLRRICKNLIGIAFQSTLCVFFFVLLSRFSKTHLDKIWISNTFFFCWQSKNGLSITYSSSWLTVWCQMKGLSLKGDTLIS